MKNKTLSIVFLFLTFNMYGQATTNVFSLDTLNLKKFNEFLKTANKLDVDADRLNFAVLSRNSKRNCFERLLVYTKIFDFFLQNGLDMSFDCIKNPPMMISAAAGDLLEERKEAEINNTQCSLLRHCTDLFEDYERDVVIPYKEDKTRSLEKDIDNILKYNLYTSPQILRDILLLKFKKIK